MEHSLLHGLQICGLIFALGGVLFRILVLKPILRERAKAGGEELCAAVAKWTAIAAAVGALAGGADLFVQCAELEGRTIFGGVNGEVLKEYLFETTVGRIALSKALLLSLAALLAWKNRGTPMVLCCLVAAVAASTMVSHAAALPAHRPSTVAAQMLHVGGAAFWLGMLFHLGLSVSLSARQGLAERSTLTRLVARFSPFALASWVVVSASGVYSVWRFVDSPKALLLSAYGLTLLLKLLLLGLAVAAGYVNWRVIRPQLNAEESERLGTPPILGRFRRMVEFELSAGVLLLIVAGILASISPPSEAGAAQLNSAQVTALLQPRLPSTSFPDPAKFVGAEIRTDDDLKYAEFTHQWSGVFVTLLGLCWFGQSIGWLGGVWARLWPLLLVPFGCFISAIADPEVWILRTYSVWEVLTNAQVLEHQLGALLVFGLAVLGFRDRKRPSESRPLGRAFPIVAILGSLMLLGHAHSSFGVAEELSSLINFQHAIIGGLGLIGGMARWFQLRQLPGGAAWKYLWPLAIVGLGVFMAFFYRELTPGTDSTRTNYSMINRWR